MASYKAAIEWIAWNDDTEFLSDAEEPILSTTCSMIADLWKKTDQQVVRDLRKVVAERDAHYRSASLEA